MMPGYLFDSHALLAFFQKEEGAEAQRISGAKAA
jgi:PIN domain nuclease of toxin-antitoxin system